VKFKPAGIAFCIGCESFQSAKTVQALLVASYLAVPNIVSSPTETVSPSLGYVIFTPKLDIFSTWEIAGVGIKIKMKMITRQATTIVYVAVLKLNPVSLNPLEILRSNI